MGVMMDALTIIAEIQKEAEKLNNGLELGPDMMDLGVVSGCVNGALKGKLLPLTEKSNANANRHAVFSAIVGQELVSGKEMTWQMVRALRLRWQGDVFKPNALCMEEVPILRDFFLKSKGQQVME